MTTTPEFLRNYRVEDDYYSTLQDAINAALSTHRTFPGREVDIIHVTSGRAVLTVWRNPNP